MGGKDKKNGKNHIREMARNSATSETPKKEELRSTDMARLKVPVHKKVHNSGKLSNSAAHHSNILKKQRERNFKLSDLLFSLLEGQKYRKTKQKKVNKQEETKLKYCT